MASRLPIIATNVGGNPELIEPGMTGQLVAAGDTEALAKAMLVYFGNRSLARRHAKAARRVAESRFSLKRMVGDYTALYEHSLAAAGIPIPGGAQALAAR